MKLSFRAVVQDGEPAKAPQGRRKERAGKQRAHSLLGTHFIGYHLESGQYRCAERGGDGHVGGVAAYSHHNPANTGTIVPGVHRPPSILKVNFEPRAKVHGLADGGTPMSPRYPVV